MSESVKCVIIEMSTSKRLHLKNILKSVCYTRSEYAVTYWFLLEHNRRCLHTDGVQPVMKIRDPVRSISARRHPAMIDRPSAVRVINGTYVRPPFRTLFAFQILKLQVLRRDASFRVKAPRLACRPKRDYIPLV